MSFATASSIARLFQCPGSASLPTVETPSAPAERGTVVHEYLERVGAGMAPDEALDLVEDGEHRALCAAIDLDRLPRGTAPEVAFALDWETGKARELGRRLKRVYPALGPTEIPGTEDMVGLTSDAVYVGDAKTGHHVVAARENLQLMLLATAAARTYNRDQAITEIIRIRENGSVWRDRAELDVVDLDAFASRLRDVMRSVRGYQAARAKGQQPDVVEGEHCRFCPSWSFCPAKAATLVRVSSGRELDPLASLLPLTPELAGHAWTKLREARRVLERIERACHAALDEYGSLPLPSGSFIQKVTEPGNEQLDGRVVFDVIRSQFDQEVAESAIEIEASKAGIARALKAAAAGGKIPPRGRAAAERRILEAVRDRGGASNPMTTRVVEIDPEKQLAPPASPPPRATQEPAAPAADPSPHGGRR